MAESPFNGGTPGDAHKLPCGCYGMLYADERVYIYAEAFLCEKRHKQGEPVSMADELADPA